MTRAQIKLAAAFLLCVVGLSVFVCSKINYSKHGRISDVIGGDIIVMVLGTAAWWLLFNMEQ